VTCSERSIMKRRILLIALGVLFLVVGIVVAGFWYMSTQPLYKPGMLRDGQGLHAPLAPPTQPTDSGTWLVEPEIRLAHFAVGEGRNVLVLQ
jgi:hypothetical protein